MPAVVPDVSVIVPVYNTMPYLTACLDSVVEQTIGSGRMQVVAVDDGSTDGSGQEVDRFAALHPDLFTVIHQENSGSPAAPCNRGLEVATGRYVFFLGADDYLGTEAMARLVAAADEWGSDVVLGRIVGVNGRFVDDRIFKETRSEISLYDSVLPFAVSNTKLFRRELVEQHQLRFPESLAIGSDQPFTIEAMVRARRISVVADYTCVYGVRRDDASNISYATHNVQRLSAYATMMQHVATLLPAGAERDAVLHRHFAWELAKLLGSHFPELEAIEKKTLVEGIGALVDDYLTDRISDRLKVQTRLRLRLAQTRDVAGLCEVIGDSAPDPLLALAGDRVYLALPGFRDRRAWPDAWFDVTDKVTEAQVVSQFRRRRIRMSGNRLLIDADAGFHPDSVSNLRLVLVELPASLPVPRVRRYQRGSEPMGLEHPVSLTRRGPSEPVLLHADADLTALLKSHAPAGMRWRVCLRADVGTWTYDLPVAAGFRKSSEVRRGTRRFRLTAGHGRRKLLYITRSRVPLLRSSPRLSPR